jgi:hypothetical protein
MKNPYAYEVIPPIGRLLALLCDQRSVGGCFRPGNRQLADRMGYASASQIPYLLSQLACDGWISYDPDTRLITLLRAYVPDQAIRSPDRDAENERSDDLIGSRAISATDRDLPQLDAADPCDRSVFQPESQCMESLVATTSNSESVVVVANGGDARGGRNRPSPSPAARLMAELGANPKIIRAAYAARPDWTPEHVRQRWDYDQRRIAASDGRLTEGIFFTALKRGELAPARPDPTAPLDPQSYAGDSLYRLGSDTSGLAPPADAPEVDEPPMSETPRDRAHRLLGPWTADNHAAQIRDSMFLQCRLGQGDSDADALTALAGHRKAARR